MIYNKNNFAIHKFNNNDTIRIEQDRTIATDGRVLVEVSRPNIATEEYPHIEGFKNSTEITPFNITTKTCKAVEKMQKKHKSLTVLNSIAVEQTDDGKAKFASTNLTDTNIIPSLLIDNYFPDTDYVKETLIKDKKVMVTIALNPTLLKDICSIVEKIDDTIYINIVDSNSAVQFKAKNPTTEQTISGLIMPKGS